CWARSAASAEGGGYAVRVTLLCVPIMVDDPAHALDDAAAAKRAGADAVEFRFDAIFGSDVDSAGLDHARRIVRDSPLPVIATCRAASEGGEWTGSEDARVELFEALLALDAPPRWIDVEL